MDSSGELESVDPFGSDGDGGTDGGEAGGAEAVTVLPGARDAAVAFGRALGLDEARRRGEVGKPRDDRVVRAAGYAAWEFDTRASRKRKPPKEGAVT